MKSIMSIFAEKLLKNLVFSSHEEADSQRLVNITLDVFAFYCGTTSSCRMLATCDIMQ